MYTLCNSVLSSRLKEVFFEVLAKGSYNWAKRRGMVWRIQKMCVNKYVVIEPAPAMALTHTHTRLVVICRRRVFTIHMPLPSPCIYFRSFFVPDVNSNSNLFRDLSRSSRVGIQGEHQRVLISDAVINGHQLPSFNCNFTVLELEVRRINKCI